MTSATRASARLLPLPYAALRTRSASDTIPTNRQSSSTTGTPLMSLRSRVSMTCAEDVFTRTVMAGEVITSRTLVVVFNMS